MTDSYEEPRQVGWADADDDLILLDDKAKNEGWTDTFTIPVYVGVPELLAERDALEIKLAEAQAENERLRREIQQLISTPAMPIEVAPIYLDRSTYTHHMTAEFHGAFMGEMDRLRAELFLAQGRITALEAECTEWEAMPTYGMGYADAELSFQPQLEEWRRALSWALGVGSAFPLEGADLEELEHARAVLASSGAGTPTPGEGVRGLVSQEWAEDWDSEEDRSYYFSEPDPSSQGEQT